MGPMHLIDRLLYQFRCIQLAQYIERAILELGGNDRTNINVNIVHILLNVAKQLLAEHIISGTG